MIRRGCLLIAVCFLAARCTLSLSPPGDAAVARYSDGDYDAAVEIYTTAVVAAPDNSALYYDLSLSYARIGRIDDALAALDYVTRLGDPQIAALAWYALGNLYVERGRIENAIQAFRESLRIDPSSDDARYNLELMMLARLTPTEQRTLPAPATSTPTLTPTLTLTPTPTRATESPPSGGVASPTSSTTQDQPGASSSLLAITSLPPMPLDEANRLFDAVMQQEQPLSWRTPTRESSSQGASREW